MLSDAWVTSYARADDLVANAETTLAEQRFGR